MAKTIAATAVEDCRMRGYAIPGGVPVRAGDDVIGSVGVSGSRGVDEQCVMAGIDKVREQLQ